MKNSIQRTVYSVQPKAVSRKLLARGGFTLLELLVVVGMVAIVGTIVADIFVNVTRSYNKAEIIARVERSGNATLSQMVGEIRNARSVVSPAPGSSGSSLEIVSATGLAVIFSFIPQTGSDNGYVARNGVAITDNSYSTGVNITSLSFTVVNATPLVTAINLGLEQPLGAPGRVDFRADTSLQTSVSLRTYE